MHAARFGIDSGLLVLILQTSCSNIDFLFSLQEFVGCFQSTINCNDDVRKHQLILIQINNFMALQLVRVFVIFQGSQY